MVKVLYYVYESMPIMCMPNPAMVRNRTASIMHERDALALEARPNPEARYTRAGNGVRSSSSSSFRNYSLFSMLATRASVARSASRLARNFATVVDTAGVKVAAVDNGQPTSAVTFLVKGGSRFESKPGVAHALKGFAFKVCPR